MKKINWKRGVVTAVTAGLMLTSVPGVAMAATVSQTGELIKKEYTAVIGADEQFTFKLKYNKAASEKQGSNELADPTYANTVTKTSDGGFTVTTTKGSWATGDSASLTAAQVFTGVDFSAPGQYVFDVEEVSGQNANIKYSTAKFQIVVNVSWPDNYPAEKTPVVRDVKVRDNAQDKTKESAATFKNDKADSLGTLKVTKKVSGSAANTADTFTFHIVLGGTAQGTYTIKIGNSTETIAAGAAGKDITLGHNQTAIIENLPQGSTWTVTETNANGYTSTNVVATEEGALESGDSVTSRGEDDTADASANGTLSAEGTSDTDAVLFTNEKGFAANTGITMNTLPFVGVGVVAAAGAVTLVISRKRRAGEDF